MFVTSSAAGRLERGNTQRPTGSCTAGRVYEAALFGGLGKMLSARYEVDRDLRQNCWRSVREWCFGAARWPGKGGGGKGQPA